MEERAERAPRSPAPAAADDPRVAAFRLLLGVVDRLRAPDGCPWDLEQTLASMAPQLVEESYELLEAIERDEGSGIAEESGDVLMNVALICRIAEDAGRFDLSRVAAGTAEKLIRRHPHVFGDVEAADAGAALASWEAVKQRERQDRDEDASALAGVPRSLPALQRARRVAEKAIAAGFRWQSAEGALAQLGGELEELRAVLAQADLERPAPPALDAPLARRAEEELGDVLLAGAVLGAYLGLDAEGACRGAVQRFEQRFRRLEGELGRPLSEVPLPELLERWRRGRGAPAGEGPGARPGT